MLFYFFTLDSATKHGQGTKTNNTHVDASARDNNLANQAQTEINNTQVEASVENNNSSNQTQSLGTMSYCV